MHQWVRIGEHTMIQGGALVGQDVPPFITVTNENQFAGINRIGMSRRGFTPVSYTHLSESNPDFMVLI